LEVAFLFEAAMSSQLQNGKQQFIDQNGLPLASGTVAFYSVGTNTPKPTYQDAAATIANTNPILLDSRGQAVIWGSGAYRQVVKDESGVTIWDQTVSSGDVNFVTVKSFGAVGNGSTDDTAALQSAASSGSDLIFPAGVYPVTGNITFDCQTQFATGAILRIASGATVIFNGTINAGLTQIFDTTAGGAIDVNPAGTVCGYPEWWGAVSGVTSADCTQALQACHVACSVMTLQASDYWVSAGVQFATSNRIIRGTLNHFTSGRTCTRIVSRSASADVVFIGPSTQPSAIASFPSAIYMLDVQATRATAPSIASNAHGFRFQFVQFSRFERLYSSESMVGFYYTGLSECKFEDCDASRVQAATGTGSDYFQGHFFDGSTNIGTSGASASLYVVRPHAGCATSTINSTGVLINGNFSDLWIDTPEVGATTTPINIIGNANTGTIVDDGNLDLLITNPILDQFQAAGISVSNISRFGSVRIRDGYASPKAGSTTANACFYVANSNGLVEWTGADFVMNNIPCLGTFISGSSGVRSKNNIIESQSVAVELLNATNCDIEDKIVNQSVAAAQPAVLVTTSTDNTIQPRILGGASKRPTGISIADTASIRNTVDVSGINGIPLGGKNNAAFVVTASGGQFATAPGRINGNLIRGLTSGNSAPPQVSTTSTSSPAANTDYSAPVTFAAPVDGTLKISATAFCNGGAGQVISLLENSSVVLGPAAFGAASNLLTTLHVTAGSSTLIGAVVHTGGTAPTFVTVTAATEFFPD
jgi:hypothetical protein